MKLLFYVGLAGLALFEIMNVYFIMPMPGSQQINSIDFAYFLYTYRWVFRAIFILMILAGSVKAFSIRRKWIPALAIIPVLPIVYFVNFMMVADHMFLQPVSVEFSSRQQNTLNDSSLVISVSSGHESKAYPVRYIQYHHQVRDSIGGRPIMVTYCNVCRTGRVFEPVVDGKPENFRLVGMDHFNAMFEDETTKSWWRQATGEAVAGALKGKALPEVTSGQYSLAKFFSLYPFGRVMNADTLFVNSYDSLGRFEKGLSKGDLTRTDSLSWEAKSWVVGVTINGKSKAFDWIHLKGKRAINESVGGTPVVVAIASDDQSFVVLERRADEMFEVKNDSIVSADAKYDFAGLGSNGQRARIVKAYQEFWHSWKQFHPETERYPLE